jgi:hypothetical protein
MFRLKTGDDIIAEVINEDGFTYRIKEPMAVEMTTDPKSDKDYCNMYAWLPDQILAINEVTLDRNDILFEMIPSEDFFEFYENQLHKLSVQNEIKDKVSSMSDTELRNMFQLFQLNSEQHKLH